MNRIDRARTDALGCELQAEVVQGQTWGWSGPCPFALADVSAACIHCGHLKPAATSGGDSDPYVFIGGDPVP